MQKHRNGQQSWGSRSCGGDVNYKYLGFGEYKE